MLKPGRWPNVRRTTYDDPPAQKAARAVTYATQDESSPVGTSTAVSVAQYSAPRFATQDVTPDNAQSLSVATQLYPSSPRSWSSTPCFDLADFDSECFRVAMSSSPVSDVVPVVPVDSRSVPVSADFVDRGGCGVTGARRWCCVFGYVYYYEPVLTTQHPGSPVSMMSVNQVVAESPTSNDAPVVPSTSGLDLVGACSLVAIYFGGEGMCGHYLDCVHLAGISWSRASPDSLVLLSCGVFWFVLKLWRKADGLWKIVSWIVAPVCAFCGE